MKPVILIVLDGWGIGTDPETNAQEKANIPFYKSLINEYPHNALECAGEAVGLPAGTMGNSEVGHLNLGAGRTVYQDYARINMAIEDGSFKKNKALSVAMASAIDNNSALHLIGLLSDGGVHSHIEHMYTMIDMALDKGVKNVFIHALMDGRDTPPDSGINYITALEAFIADKPNTKIASVIGRFWAMDRDKRWERVEEAYKALVNGEGVHVSSASEAVEKSYALKETDEFIKPSLVCNDGEPVGLLSDSDSVIFFNFRADRAREITSALAVGDFNEFKREKAPALGSYVTMTMYEEDFTFPAAFPSIKLTNILGEVLSRNGLKQLRIAETEKYAHVTYFFNGGEEDPFPGEERCLIPSPRDVATYDLKPEMSAFEVRDEVLKRLDWNKYDFILLNFANPDMVGHTGIMKAAIKACETIDSCLESIVNKVQSMGGTVMITSDHGNCDNMGTHENPFTAHTTNPVPFIILKKNIKLNAKGILADVAPTVLDLMGIEKPEDMTGKSLIHKN
ncbi:2,3-bisphosphoglycerate-independent phosphoglycerate mutase [bacterium BMS3Abin09]|nr:2,3-bisphosphoglycerate-independent phosphoglycerate mutase [bacterium BMS3Abin09]GBE41464.1 2,3-bisphosphoglycerate-independent phosphoglycerate mutase [bacterium BMS3Bbin09]HDH34320.1 2,3-bisphosphoglycerate-independent phosphoglycerate mutase [Nitrospirota bacterium]